MRQITLRTALLAALVCPIMYADNNNECITALPTFLRRSQTYWQLRHMVGKENPYLLFNQAVDECECDLPYLGYFGITIEGMKSFRDDKLAECLFGAGLSSSNCDDPTINISGSLVSSRGNRDWLADYFLLPRDYQSTITVSPQVSDIIVDFDWWMRLDAWYPGLFFAVHAPFVSTRWKLDAQETRLNNSNGTIGYEAGYFAASAIDVGRLNTHTALNYLNGQFKLSDSGIEAKALNCSKWATCGGCNDDPLVENKLSDVEFILGWRIWDCPDYHFGLELRGSAPAGTRPDCNYFFEPIVGNGHFGTLGVGITSHVLLWEDCECDRSLAFWFDANIIHFFKTRQCRTFDLCGRPNSRYALAMKFTDQNVDDLSSNPTQATANGGGLTGPTNGYTNATRQFANVYEPVANLTCGNVDVKVSVQGDVVALFNYSHCNWSVDFGYNFYGRACEDIEFDCECPTTRLLSETNTWALKGDAYVYGYEVIPNAGNGIATDSIALAGTQSTSSIYTGRNRACNASIDQAVQRRNSGVDNAAFAYSRTEDGAGIRNPLVAVPVANATALTELVQDQTRTSNTPVFLSQQNIDIWSNRQRLISNTVFAHIGYTWDPCGCWQPFLGIGGKAEFGQTCGGNNNCSSFDCSSTFNTVCNTTGTGTSCNTDCKTSCKKCTLSQWGLWIKGGFSFEA